MLRFLNLGNIPVMVWLSIYAIALWVISVLWLGDTTEILWVLMEVLRNAAVALVATKLLTQPLTYLADKTETLKNRDLVGQQCSISTAEATEQFGQATVETSASPLLLNVRTRGETMTKGDLAQIVDFDPERHIFFVEKCSTEEQP